MLQKKHKVVEKELMFHMTGADRLIDIAFLHASPKFCGNESLAELNF